MRIVFLVFLMFCSAVIGFAQAKVVFDQNVHGNLIYPGARLDSFMNLGSYRAIVVGETHTSNVEPDFKFNLIRQLNEQHQIRDIFMEVGYSAAWLFNRYLTTGDTSVFRNPITAYAYSRGNYHAFWENLYLYNQSLPVGQQLKIHGVDFERTEIFKVLIMLMPQNKVIPVKLQQVVKQIGAYAADTTLTPFKKNFIQKLEEVSKTMRQEMPEVEDFYGSNASIVRLMIDNESPHTTATRKRNDCMAKNMQQLLKAERIKRFVGFFGAAHTGYGTRGTLPNRIREWSGFEDKTLVINTVYYQAYSNFTKDTTDVIGWVNRKNSQAIHDQYLGKTDRAVLLKSSVIDDQQLKRAADFTLLVNDTIKE